jgi:hypothetical protein
MKSDTAACENRRGREYDLRQMSMFQSDPAREIARFGDMSVLVGGPDQPGAERQANRVRLDGPGPFHVVVQKGRSFQRANPHVRVVVDRGRFLVVELPAGARVVREPARFTIAEARSEPLGFHVERAVAGARRSGIDAILGRVTTAGLRGKVESLAALRTRHSRLPVFEPALSVGAEWLREGNCLLERVDVAMPGGQTANLIGRRRGDAASPKLYVVCAHLDSVNHEGGPDAPAPGADDNASGSVTVVAMAQAIANEAAQHDVHFVLFGGEEQGLFGSADYVSRLTAADRARLGGVVNIDMAASRNTPDLSVLLEGAAVSRPLVNALARAAATYTTLVTQVSLNPFDSDHVPFIDAGLPAVLTIEGTDGAFEHEHTGRDTPDRLDFELHREITTMNLAWLAEEVL